MHHGRGRIARMAMAAAFVLLALLVAHAAFAAKRPKKPRPGARLAGSRMIYDHNLIVNGDAEIESDGFAPGWKPDETVQSEVYGHTAGEWDWEVEGAPEGGTHYFRLAVPDGQESIEVDQWVSVAAESASVDRDRVSWTLSGWLGGIVDAPGTAVLEVAFLDRSGRSLADAATEATPGAALPRPKLGQASLVERTRSGDLPAGTRRLHVTLRGLNTRFADCPSCAAVALADRLSLVLAKKPSEP